jgi:hypothetical protein
VIEDAIFSFADRSEMRRRGSRKQASEHLWRRAFRLQIDEKGCFSGLSLLASNATAWNFGPRMRFKTTSL